MNSINQKTLALSRNWPSPELARRIVQSALQGIRQGNLRIVEAGQMRSFGSTTSEQPSAQIDIHDSGIWPQLLLGGTVGAGEAYAAGHWSADDLVAAIRVMLQNEEVRHRLEGGWSRLRAPLMKIFHRFRDNTPRGSVRNIRAHYDVGNDFFRLFLDPTMSYSSGIFESEDSTLEDASKAKLRRICTKLSLESSDHLLEIGSGWGGLAMYAARNYGCRVTTTTVSAAQHAEVVERVKQAGLSNRITVLQRDYRDLDGRFDKLVSVEMIEAVGHRHLPTFFGHCAQRLKPGGRFVLQAITLPARAYERSLGRVDYIQRHVFPGSQVPSIQAMTNAWSAAGDFRLEGMEEFAGDYARTLRLWRAALTARRTEAMSLGFTQDQLRSWDFYFAYCEAGFSERHLGLAQLSLVVPKNA